MFLRHYGLREQPFGVTPDPRFLFSTRVHQEALASMQYGIQEGRGFMALIAEPGMGKTTLLFQLLEQLRGKTRTAYLFHTQCDSAQILASLVAELEFDPSASREQTPAPREDLQESLNRLLLRESQAGRTPVVIIDEAQNLQEPVMETIRLLSNFETPTAKLMQIVLAGQIELGQRLANPRLSQLRQRISIISRLAPLDAAEVAPYIENRLRVAGYSGEPLFAPAAYLRIAELSRGVPRNINNLCFHALSLGCALGVRRIDLSVLDEVASDLDWSEFSPDGIARPEPARPTQAEVSAASPRHPTTSRAESLTPRPAPSSPARPTASITTVPQAGAAAPHTPAAETRTTQKPGHTSRRSVLRNYGISLAVVLAVLAMGLAWVAWRDPELLSMFTAPSARAAAPEPAASTGSDNATILLRPADSPAKEPASETAASVPSATAAPASRSTHRAHAVAQRSEPVPSRSSNSNTRGSEALFAPELLPAPFLR
jgi:type II secretory pathway predicted ATPase ExeA